MSTTKHPGSKLVGWCGPWYPTEADTINLLMSKAHGSINKNTLHKLFATLPRFLHSHADLSTTDGYSWFLTTMFYLRGRNQLAVTFPWAQNWEHHDGTQADRSVAVFTKSKNFEEDAGNVLRQMITVLRKRVTIFPESYWEPTPIGVMGLVTRVMLNHKTISFSLTQFPHGIKRQEYEVTVPLDQLQFQLRIVQKDGSACPMLVPVTYKMRPERVELAAWAYAPKQ